jgi:hypothetical protein
LHFSTADPDGFSNGQRFALLGAFIATGSTMLSSAAVLRETINFNREWKFQIGDVTNASGVKFDDSKWDRANLPHSFSMPYFAANEKFYVGYGWYRRHFVVPKAWVGRRVNLEFDGAFQMTELFVNGKRIGEHTGGYDCPPVTLTTVNPTGSCSSIKPRPLPQAKSARIPRKTIHYEVAL